MTGSLRIALSLLALLVSGAAALADPPGRVGRLGYAEGAVSFHAADQDQWSPATINYPVVAGETFWTEPGGRAEIEVGASEIRLDETTLLTFVALDDGATRLQVDQGVLNIHLRAMPPGGVQVQTPRAQLNLVEPGSYHIDAGRPDGGAPPDHTEITVLEGRVTTAGPRSTLTVLPGETAIIGGEPQSFTLREGNATPFDDWALMREKREAALEASRYVSPEATGYRDLDSYGRWNTNPTYGAVWYPTAVDPDWAPYRYGHWAFVPPWGWTWIDDAPWGFAPFHYGRWVTIDGAWAWVPGTVVARPVYAPALVAFVGGAGFGITISAGAPLEAVGWVPLAPFEVYHPYYRTSPTYVRNVNITNVNRTVINNITTVNVTNTTVVNNFANRQAATVVPAAAFTRAAPVQKATVAVPREQLAQTRVAPDVAHLKPTAAARAGVAIPAAAGALVPRANAPATIAPKPVAPANAQAVAEPVVPKAPGPALPNRPQAPATRQAVRGPSSAAAPGASPAPQPAHAAATVPPPAGVPVWRARPGEVQQPAAGKPPPAVDKERAPAPIAAPKVSPPPATTTPKAAPAPVATAIAPKPPTPPKAPSPAPAAKSAAPAMAKAPPPLPAQRPVQQTRIAPTPSGWQRTPAPPQAAAPQHAPTPAQMPKPTQGQGQAHPPPGKDQKPQAQ
ncbi:MAG TPA: DUF6600 domain-containing protein [Stellaceae bacterium]|nr:DUF6600 domain-containing protein [Stellaceae bacterium]